MKTFPTPKPATKIIEAPLAFGGSLEQFYRDWANHVLLNLSAVEEFHRKFCEYYLGSEDP